VDGGVDFRECDLGHLEPREATGQPPENNAGGRYQEIQDVVSRRRSEPLVITTNPSTTQDHFYFSSHDYLTNYYHIIILS
jgi:hypothetical protein